MSFDTVQLRLWYNTGLHQLGHSNKVFGDILININNWQVLLSCYRAITLQQGRRRRRRRREEQETEQLETLDRVTAAIHKYKSVWCVSLVPSVIYSSIAKIFYIVSNNYMQVPYLLINILKINYSLCIILAKSQKCIPIKISEKESMAKNNNFSVPIISNFSRVLCKYKILVGV